MLPQRPAYSWIAEQGVPADQQGPQESGAAHTPVVEEDATGAIVRDNISMTEGVRRFMRLRVVEQ